MIARDCGGAAACASRLLPCGRDGARVADYHSGFERADVYTEFEGVSADDGAHRAVAQAALDLAALVGQVATAIAPNFGLWILDPRMAGGGILEVGEEDFHSGAGAGEDDGLDVVGEELGGDVGRLAAGRSGAGQALC